MNTMLGRLRELTRADFLSAKDLVRHALLIVALFLVAHFAGLREFTTIVSGTLAAPHLGAGLCALLGVGYMACYFATVVLVPVLLLAAGLLFALEKVRAPSRRRLP